MQELQRRVTVLEECTNKLVPSVARIEGMMSTVSVLVKYVITPLIVILGALVGIKIALP